MFIDVLIVSFLLLQVWFGWRSGLLWQVTAIVSVILGIILGSSLAPYLGTHLVGTITSNQAHAEVAAFLFVAGCVGLGFRLLTTYVEVTSEAGLKKDERSKRRAQDRVLGGIFGAAKGCALSLVLSAAAVGFWPTSTHLKSSKLTTAFALGGVRLLPNGSVKDMQAWMATSSQEVQRTLQIKLPEEKPSSASTAKPQ